MTDEFALPHRIVRTLINNGFKPDHVKGYNPGTARWLANQSESYRIDNEIDDLKNQGYYLVGFFNAVPWLLDVELHELQIINKLKRKLLSYNQWMSVNSIPLTTYVYMVTNPETAVYFKLIAADIILDEGVHKL